MKKYKLLKWYPGLPTDWKEGMEVGIGDYIKGYYTPCSSEYSDFCASIQIVEYNSDYWQEIVEQDYEILSFIGKVDHIFNYLYDLDKDGFYQYKGGRNNLNSLSLYCMLHEGACVDSGDLAIHSVKRLSDGEIFTIGDIVNYNQHSHYGDWKIDNFFLKDNEILARSESNWICEFIRDLKHVKEPLFVTEDGVEISEISNEKPYFQLTPEWNIYEIGNKQYERRECDKHFSTEAATIEYKDLNKPKYSIQDLINMSEEILKYSETRCKYISMDKTQVIKLNKLYDSKN